jgi:probable HAF family extracellular repeat protein
VKICSAVLIVLVLTLGVLSTGYAAGYSYTSLDYPGASQTPPGFGNSGTLAVAINNAGTIVGQYEDTSGIFRGFSLSNGSYTSLMYPGASGIWVSDVNDGGAIVGEYQTASGGCNGFLLSGGTYSSLTYPDATGCTKAGGINNAGTIVGRYKASGVVHGFLLSGGTTYTSLTYPGATYTEARAINNGGTIVGYYEDASGGYHGFLLSNGTYTALNYPGASATYAFGINDGNTIDGYYEDASGVGHGFLLSNGTYTALNYPGASGTYAGHGNNAGAIVGAYLDASSVDHGFLAIPATALSSGWNLVSLPFQPANTAIASVLSGIADAYEVVWAYPGQSWKVYDPNDAGGSTLTTMQAGMGYWIKMTSAKTLSVSGAAPSSSLSLSSGWNLVGYSGTSCATASTALSSLGSALQVSWGYPGQVWQFYDPTNSGGSTLGNLCPGTGYWIDVNGGATWSGW